MKREMKDKTDTVYLTTSAQLAELLRCSYYQAHHLLGLLEAHGLAQRVKRVNGASLVYAIERGLESGLLAAFAPLLERAGNAKTKPVVPTVKPGPQKKKRAQRSPRRVFLCDPYEPKIRAWLDEGLPTDWIFRTLRNTYRFKGSRQTVADYVNKRVRPAMKPARCGDCGGEIPRHTKLCPTQLAIV